MGQFWTIVFTTKNKKKILLFWHASRSLWNEKRLKMLEIPKYQGSATELIITLFDCRQGNMGVNIEACSVWARSGASLVAREHCSAAARPASEPQLPAMAVWEGNWELFSRRLSLPASDALWFAWRQYFCQRCHKQVKFHGWIMGCGQSPSKASTASSGSTMPELCWPCHGDIHCRSCIGISLCNG